MVNIDLLTLGNEFKDMDGNIYKVVGNISEGDEIMVRLEKVVPVNEPLQELIKEF